MLPRFGVHRRRPRPTQRPGCGAVVPTHRNLELERVTRGIRARLFAQPLDPVQVGRYRIERRIGRGGFGEVFEATDTALKRRIALKVLAQTTRDDWRTEARALASLRHEHVVEIYEAGQASVLGTRRDYLAMELLDGASLAAWLSADRSGDEVAEVFRQTAQALHHAHISGVVHGDFKPSNVIVTPDGQAKIVDFGLARLAVETTAARRGGTARYMAPELVDGPLTPWSDQYAWCVALRDAWPQARWPRWVSRVVVRGTHPDPTRRWPDMHAVAEALNRKHSARRYVLVGALGLGALIYGAQADSVVSDPCLEHAQRWASATASLGTEGARKAFVAVAGAAGAGVWSRVVAYSRLRGEAWTATRLHVCRTEGDVPTPRQHCLDAQLARFGRAVAALADPDAEGTLSALAALQRVAGVDECGVNAPGLARFQSEAAADLYARADAIAQAADHDEPGALQKASELAAEAERKGVLGAAASAKATECSLHATADGFAAKEQACEAAFFLATQAGADRLATRTAMTLVTLMDLTQRFDRAQRWLGEAKARAIALDDVSVSAYVRRREAQLMSAMGDVAAARDVLEPLVAELRQASSLEGLEPAHALRELGIVHETLGQAAQARELFIEARVVASRAVGPAHPLLSEFWHSEGIIDDRLGLVDEAIVAFRRAEQLEREYGGFDQWNSPLLLSLAVVLANDGQVAQASEHLAQAAIAIEGANEPLPLFRAVLLSTTASVDLAAGRAAQARSNASKAVRLIESDLGPDHPQAFYAWLQLAEAHVKLGAPAPAIEAADQALRVGQALRHDDALQALAQTPRAEALAAQGNVVEAIAAASTAEAALRAETPPNTRTLRRLERLRRTLDAH